MEGISIIPITKDEKERLKAKFPDIHIVRTMKQSSKRYHYFMVEELRYLEALKQIRDNK